jgi:phage tail-like protein
MAVALTTSKPHLMEYLPAIYQEADASHPKTFLGQFLLAFEKVLLGLGEETAAARHVVTGDVEADTGIEGLGEKIARLHELFDPGETPEEFLPWLASWAALSLRSDLSVMRKRKLLARIIPLYRIRGTRKYLEELLMLCVDAVVMVNDREMPELQVGVHSTVDSDTYLGGGAPYFFKVTLLAPRLNAREVETQIQIARAMIELAKPAHTSYELDVISPRLQLGVHSTVGEDTVLGAATA